MIWQITWPWVRRCSHQYGQPCTTTCYAVPMVVELARDDTSITSHLTADDWLEVIDGQVFGTDIHTGEVVR